MDAYNRADKDKARFPDVASRASYSWGAVKRVFKKSKTGKWVKMQEPKTDEERAKAHFNISDEDWEQLKDQEKRDYINKLPPVGTKRASIYSVQCEANPFEWKRIGDSLKITGTIIAEGTWAGLDQEIIHYPRAIFPDSYETIVGGAIKRGHAAGEDDVVGFVTAARCLDDRINIEGIIFDQNTIEDVILNNLTGLSMEANVKASFNESMGANIAQSMNLLKATLVENPACDPCRVGTVSTVALEDQEKKKEKKTMSSENEYMLLYAKPTKEKFFDFVEAKLKAKDIEDATIAKIMNVLQSAIEVPHSPYPTPVKAEEPEKEEEKKEEPKELEYMPTMLRKPSKASFLRWMEAQLTDEEDRAIVMKTLKRVITAPFLGEDVKLSVDFEVELQKKVDEITELTTKLTDIKKAEVNALLAQIKEVDEAFEEKELLEGVECPDIQKKLLGSYLSVVSKQVKTPIHVETPDGVEASAKTFLESMGISDVKEFIEG